MSASDEHTCACTLRARSYTSTARHPLSVMQISVACATADSSLSAEIVRTSKKCPARPTKYTRYGL